MPDIKSLKLQAHRRTHRFSHIGERVKHRRTKLRLKSKELAERCGMATGTLGDLESGESKSTKFLHHLARELKTTEDWLEKELGPEEPIGMEHVKGRIRLLSWTEACHFASAVDNFIPSEAETVFVDVPINKHTYALRITEDCGTTFPIGTLLIVEPELEAEVGDYIIAREADSTPTVRRLVLDGEDLSLEPLDPRYQVRKVTDKTHICGVVIQSQIIRKHRT